MKHTDGPTPTHALRSWCLCTVRVDEALFYVRILCPWKRWRVTFGHAYSRRQLKMKGGIMRLFTTVAALTLAGCNATLPPAPQTDPTPACLRGLQTEARFSTIADKVFIGNSPPSASLLANTSKPTSEESTVISRYVVARATCLDMGRGVRSGQWAPDAVAELNASMQAVELELNKLAAGQVTYAQSAETRFKIGTDTIRQLTALEQRHRSAVDAQRNAANAGLAQGLMMMNSAQPKPVPMQPPASFTCTSRNVGGTIYTDCR